MQQKIIPYVLENYFLLALDRKYSTVFGGELSFQVFVDKKRRLCIVSEQCLRK